MTYIVDYRTRFACDKCGRKVTKYTPDDESPMPNGWAEVAIGVWQNGHRDTTRGNEERFCQLCPTCLSGLGWYIHDANNDVADAEMP